MKKENISKGLMAAGMAGCLIAGGLAGAYVFPNEVMVQGPTVTKEVIKEVPGPEVIKEVEVPVEVAVEKIVEVDSGNLDLVLQEVYDNDGAVDYLVDGLDDDEIEQIVDRIEFANDAKALAVAEVKKELFDEIDGEDVNGVELDEDEMERLRVDDDLNEVILSDVDYEDKDADVNVTGTFEQDDVKYEYEVLIEIKDGEVDDFEIVSISEK